MSTDVNAAATLSLAIDTGGAEFKLRELKEAYDQLRAGLSQSIAGKGALSAVATDAKEAEARVKALEAEVGSLRAKLDNLGNQARDAGKSISAGLQAGLGSLNVTKILGDDQMAKIKGRFKNVGLEAAAALESGLTNANFAKTNQVLSLLEKNTSASLKRIKELSAEAKRYAADVGPQSADAKYGTLLTSGAAASIATARLADIAKAEQEAAAIKRAADAAKALGQAKNQANALELRVISAEESAKVRAAAQSAKDLAKAKNQANSLELKVIAAEEAARISAAAKDAKELARWMALTEKQRASATLQAAKAYYGGASQSTLPGVAGSSQALQAAQNAGSIRAAAAALDALSVSQNKAASAAATHEEHIRGMPKHMWEAHSAARGLAGGIGALWLTYGSTIPLVAGAALASGFLQAAKAGSEFAYQLTFVKALGGETADAVQQVSTAALALSKSGLYGPVELANGLRILSQAGLNAADAMKALPTVLDLATVGEMNMEQSAITLAGVMNAFGKSIADLPHIGDVFAKAAAVSQTSVLGMTEAMKTASVVGEQYSVNMEDAAAALTLLAKVNITGTAAGTAFRNMVKEIYAPVPQAAAAFKKLGIETKTATGDLKPFADVLFDLKGKLEQFDKAGQVQILQRLFGERGAKEAVAILSQTREEWDKLKSSISESDGFASDVARQLEDTAKGRWMQAVNTLQASLVEAFQAAEPELKKLAESFKSLFSDPAFTDGLRSIVSGMASLTSVAVQMAPVLINLAEGWLVLRAGMISASVWSATSAAITTFTGSMAAASGAMRPVAAGMSRIGTLTSALPGIVGALSNPVTTIITLLGAGATAWYLWGNKAGEAAETAKASLAGLKSAVEQVNSLFETLKYAGVGDSNSFLAASNRALAEQAKAYDSLQGVINKSGLARLNSQADLNKSFKFDYTTGDITDQAGKRYTASMFKNAEAITALIEKYKAAGSAAREAKVQADKLAAEADRRQTEQADRLKVKPVKSVDSVLGKEGGRLPKDYDTPLEKSRIKLIEEQQKKELDLLSSANSAKLISEEEYRIRLQAIYAKYDDQMEKEYAESKNRLLAVIESTSGDEQKRAQASYNTILEAYNKFSAEKELRLQQSADREAGLIKKSFEDTNKYIAAQRAKLQQTLLDMADTQRKLRMSPEEVAGLDARRSVEKEYARQISEKEEQVKNLQSALAAAAERQGKKAESLYADSSELQAYIRDLERLKQAREQDADAAEKQAAASAEYLRSFEAGWTKAYRNYLDSTTDYARQAQDIFTKSVDGMADAFTSFVSGGKADFRSLVTSILQDILKVQSKKLFSDLLGKTDGGSFNGLLSFISPSAGMDKDVKGTMSGIGEGIRGGVEVSGFKGLLDSAKAAAGATDTMTDATKGLVQDGITQQTTAIASSVAQEVTRTATEGSASAAATASLTRLSAAADAAAKSLSSDSSSGLMDGLGGLGSLFGGGGGDGFSAWGGGSMWEGSMAMFASGGVVKSPDLSRYSNQIHDTPQFFAFAKGGGVFGEAGPEAIMPLGRDAQGRLGVRSAGGGESSGSEVNITIVVNKTDSGESSSQESEGDGKDAWTSIAQRVRALVLTEMMNQKRQGGMLAS